MDIKPFLDLASQGHKHLCPRQVLGVRIGLKGMAALGFDAAYKPGQLLVVSETDGCFIDGVIAVTKCTVGHRTLRVEDYGKVAATFVNIKADRAVRIAPNLDVRERAHQYVPEEKRHYFAQLLGYQIMPDEELLHVEDVTLNISVARIISYSGIRINCERCGEEVLNEREVVVEGKRYCRHCAADGYYRTSKRSDLQNAL
ncbi:MAG TPA: FmdE family protein [Anaerolineales bacterium]|nr:FmdE family protein [Anaerolineales bacterium]